MGGFASKPTIIPTREEMLKATSDGKYFIEHAFFYMAGQMNMKDMLVMAQPAKCSEMIFLTAKALQASFKKYKINPARGDDGFVYFQKLDDMKGRCKGEIRDDSTTYIICVTIAMFYIRIFQIYGALALTILDVDPLYYQQLGGAYTGAIENTVQEGGKLRAEDILPQPFEILRRYLSPTVTDEYYKFDGTTYAIYFDKNVNMFTREISAQLTMELPRKTGQRKNPRVEFSLRIEPFPNTMVFHLTNFKGLRTTPEKKAIKLTKGIGIESDYRWGGLSIPKAIEKKVIDIVKDAGGLSTEDSDLEAKGEDKLTVDERKRVSLLGEKKVSPSLQTADLWSMFTDRKYSKAHCVARAIQLVSSQALEKSVPPAIYSSICKEKFMSSSGTLPGLGQPILKEKGLFVLHQLFYDKLQQITPIVSVETQPKYQALNKLMAQVFLNPQDTKMDSITDRSSKEYCDPKDRKGRLVLIQDKGAIMKLREQVREMLLLQVSHTAEVVKIMKELFVLEKGVPVTLNVNLVKGGLPVVNLVADKARDLLLNYYKTCEARYQVGVRVIASAPGTAFV
jgi:hypothetical protein